MSDALKISETTVETVIKSAPKAGRLFLNWNTACVGCGFARFCTLKDVVNTYRLDEKKFLEEAGQMIVQNLDRSMK